MALYRILISLALPVLTVWALIRVLRGRETWSDLFERIGRGASSHASAQRAIWLHAASMGELASAEAVIRTALQQDPGLHILVTTNSMTGRARARNWRHPRIQAQLAPFDTRWAARRLMTHHGVRALIVMEAEFWPNRLRACAARGLPVIMLGARLSRRSSRRWRRWMGLVRPVLRDVTWLLPQDRGSARRLQRLGLDPARLGAVTDLKALYVPPQETKPEAPLQTRFTRHSTWLAASTHPGEDEFVLEAHAQAQRRWPELSLIIAPRHAERGQDIQAMAQARGLPAVLRSKGAVPGPGAIYIADTMGEMAMLYDLAGICFVAGSLVDRGGHTPYEPAAHGCALLHGPFTSNFRAIYRRLGTGGGALQAQTSEEICELLMELQDVERVQTLARRGQALCAQQGDVAEIVNKILAMCRP